MPNSYEELDVFGRPKSRVGGVSYLTPDDELIALQNYVLKLKAKEAAIESGARRVAPVKEIVREAAKGMPAYVHQYDPVYTVNEEDRLRDINDPVRFLPFLHTAVENTGKIYRGENRFISFDELAGQRAPRYVNTLGGQARVGGAGVDERFGKWQEPWVIGGDETLPGVRPERYHLWPEKMVRSGLSLPGDVMAGRVFSDPGMRAVNFSDVPGAPNPLGPLIERTQDLAGLAMGGSVVDVARSGARKPVAAGRPSVPAADSPFSTSVQHWLDQTRPVKHIALRSDDEVGAAFSGARNASKDLTREFTGGNVPPSAARNIGRETMPEILARQRASEGYEAAIRDPETKKLYTGMWHEEVLDKIAKDRGVPKEYLPDNLIKGYVNDRGRFLTEEAVEKLSQQKSNSRTAMFRSDDEVGAAVAALHAADKPTIPAMKVEAAPTGNLPAVIPQGGVMAPGTAVNPISSRRGFLQGARDMMAAASNANKLVTMAEKLAQPAPVPKMPKVPLKEIWKTETNEAKLHDQVLDNAWEDFMSQFHEEHPRFKNYDADTSTPAQRKAYEKEQDKFYRNHEEEFDYYVQERMDAWQDAGTQFSHKQLPGATNYREHLMQMPGDQVPGNIAAIHAKLGKPGAYEPFDRHWLHQQMMEGKITETEAKTLKSYIDKKLNEERFYGDWDEPGIIGHSRVNDRQIPKVGKALHIEEIGSQLHEQGAKKGYGKPDTNKWYVKRDEKGRRSVYDQNGEHIGGEGKFTGALTDEQLKKQFVSTLRTVPDLPFKKTYVDLAVNRMLHEAASQGYDAVSWTPHELQRKNYGGDSNKEILPRIKALAEKYGGKIEKQKISPEAKVLESDGYYYAYDLDGQRKSFKDDKAAATKFTKEQNEKEHEIHVLKLTPEMKRIFGHDDFSMFPKEPKVDPLRRDVLERGRSGRPVRTEPLAIGSEQRILEAGARRNEPAPTFYSGLGRTIERAPFEEATPSQWAKHLRDTVGARQAEEFEHVGLEGKVGPLQEVKQEAQRPAQGALEEWKKANPKQRPPKELIDAASNENKRIVEQKLADKDKEAPLAKKELLAHVAENQPKFKEIVKRGDQDDAEAAIHSRAQDIMEERYPDILGSDEKWHDYFARATAQAEDELINSGNQAKYSDYQLPGGTNYREHLMTMPGKPQSFAVYKGETKVSPDFADLQEARDWGKRNGYTGTASVRESTKGAGDHYSSHWDEPNVIVHTRMNDRNLEQSGFVVQNLKSGNKSSMFETEAEAREFQRSLPESVQVSTKMTPGRKPLKSLHAEEFQSDLHQEGRKKGYKGDKVDTSKWTAEKENKLRKWGPEGSYDRWTVKDERGNVVGTLDDVNGVKPTSKQAIEHIAAQQPDSNVPNFPFKKSWPDLAVKRWLREAVDNDYDAVSWTPGEAQRDRFRLSHHLQDLQYAQNQDGTYALLGINKDGHEVKVNRGMPVKESELGRYVGDAVAEKIKKGEGKLDEIDEFRTLSNEDLKVGGEGLVSFYDKTVKSKVEALAERFGGKVEKHELNQDPRDKRVREIKEELRDIYSKMLKMDDRQNTNKEYTTLSDSRYKLAAERAKLEHEAGRTLGEGDASQFVWSVKLTPEMKRAIKREGFPLFTAGPVMTPVDHDPFDEKQKAKLRLEPVDHDPFAQPTPDMGGKLNKMISEGYRPRPRPIQNGFGVRQ